MIKKIYAIPIICTLLLTGCNSKNSEEFNTKIQGNDNTFIMVKNEESGDKILSEIYVKYEGKDKNKIASDIPAYTEISYLEGKQSILFQDDENNLVKYDSDGEEEIIGKELIVEDMVYIPYKVSLNNETIVYLTEDETLYIKENDKDKAKIANNVLSYEIDNTGKYVYYINNENNLYIYSNGDSEKIASDIGYFKVSSDGERVIFLNSEDNLYIKDVNSEDKEKIFSGAVEMPSLKIYEDGTITFLSDFDYEDYKGELYVYDGIDKNHVPSDVIQYIKKDDTFYFINEDSALYEKSLDDEKSNKLLSDVEYIESTNKGIVYVNKDGNIYSKDGNKEPIKIGKNIMSKDLFNIVNGEEVIYLTENNDLFIGENKIAQEVINYVCNLETIAYVTKDKKVHSYNLKDKTDVVEIENAKDYSYVYLENQLVFSNFLEPYELAGFWNVTPEIGESNYVVEFSGSNKMLEYYPTGEKNIVKYDIEYSYENAININTEDGIYISINREDDNNITLSFDGLTDYATKVSKNEADKIINNQKNNNNEVSKDIVWNIAEASSVLDDGNNISYSPNNVLDNKTTTTWAEGASGDGIGEWIKISTEDGLDNVENISLINGFSKSSDLYYKNNRVKKASLEFSDGTTQVIEFKDDVLEKQVIDIGNKQTSYIKITILEVYRGSKYQDTCIPIISVNDDTK